MLTLRCILTPLFTSGDKDELTKKRNALIKAKRQVCKELFPNENSKFSGKGDSQNVSQPTRKRCQEDEKVIDPYDFNVFILIFAIYLFTDYF